MSSLTFNLFSLFFVLCSACTQRFKHFFSLQENQRFPLHDAVRKNRFDKVMSLLASGQDFMALDVHGETALEVALRCEHVEIAHYLMGVMGVSSHRVGVS